MYREKNVNNFINLTATTDKLLNGIACQFQDNDDNIQNQMKELFQGDN
jgi:hypothetical protein